MMEFGKFVYYATCITVEARKIVSVNRRRYGSGSERGWGQQTWRANQFPKLRGEVDDVTGGRGGTVVI